MKLLRKGNEGGSCLILRTKKLNCPAQLKMVTELKANILCVKFNLSKDTVQLVGIYKFHFKKCKNAKPNLTFFFTVSQNSRSRTPPRSRATRRETRMACSPAHRAQRKRRQKAQNESTTSSSSSDEERFERRKNKSMAKARNR